MSTLPERVGHYSIERELGRGGMGVVYLALDERLGRRVAIKALPESLAEDPERLARFEREARTMASLSHPNVASIYGVESDQGRLHLVIEYVEGATLADRLAQGRLTTTESLEIAAQIAGALEAAHERGVVHRDLKPGNVMLTQQGRIKVLDFGLAKTAEGPSASSSSGGDSLSPTILTPINSPTIPGVILGTAGYMSPEQARGRPVDKRSDIFSFGCVLYEMLTGAGPFRGESANDSIGAVLHRDPDWSRLPSDTPPTIRLLLRRCMARDRTKRLHDIADARIELEQAIDDPALSSLGLVAATPAGARTGRRGVAALVGGLLLVAAVAAALGFRIAANRPAPEAPLRAHLTIPSKTDEYNQPGRMIGQSIGSIISHDGKRVVFFATSVDGAQGLWVRSLGDTRARPLPDTEGAQSPFWSHDGRSVAFHADGRLWAVNVSGGARRLIAPIAESLGAAWGADGVILLGQFGRGLLRVSASGGPVEEVTTLDADIAEVAHGFPHFLPDGRSFLYLGASFQADVEHRRARLYSGRLDSDRFEHIAEINSAVWYVDSGHLVYVEDGTIMAAPFDASRRRFTGDPVRIADNVWYFKPTAQSYLSVSRNGVICFIPPISGHELVWWDLDGRKLGAAGPSGSFHMQFQVSPAGDRVAIAVRDTRTSLTDIWMYGLDRSTSARLTTDSRWEGHPVWSPDGSKIYYAWDRDGAPDIFEMRADGAGVPRKIFEDSGAWFPTGISPDGKTLVLMTLRTGALRLLSLDGSVEAVPLRDTTSYQINGRVSPDSRWITYVAFDTGRAQVYIEPFRRDGRVVQVSTEGGASPEWSPDGRRLYYLQSRAGDAESGSKIMVVEFESEADFERPSPRLLFETVEWVSEFKAHPDGERLLMMIEPAEAPPMNVILNWQADLPG